MDVKKLVTDNKKWVVRGTVLAVIIAVIVSVGYIFHIRNQGEAYQEQIEALYKQSRNSLSTCIDQGRTAAQVTEREFEVLSDTLTDVASARYVDEAGNPTSAEDVLGGGALISALQESYPQVDQRSWQNLQTLVVGCRSEFQSAQDRVFVHSAQFEEWIYQDNLFTTVIKGQFPTKDLDVENLATGETLTGADALEYMTRVISVEEANKAFETGTLEEQDLFGD